MRRPILVLGATGEVGGRVVAGLIAAGWPVRAATRDPARAAARAEVAASAARAAGAVPAGSRARAAGASPGAPAGEVVWVELDLERPETFDAAVAGAEGAFLVARPGDDRPDIVAEPLLGALLGAGVSRVVDLSALGVEREPEFGLRRVERMVEASGVAWTHLRPNFFMQIFAGAPLLPALRATGEIRMPAAEARLSYVDTRDVAAVAVAVLTESGHAGEAYTLTGPEALGHREIAAALAAASGSAIAYRSLTEAEARSELAAAGLGPARVERLIGFYRRVRTGAWAALSGDVAAVLRRPARDFRGFAADYAACWRGIRRGGGEVGAAPVGRG